MLRGHRDLKVFQLASRLAMEIFHLTKHFPREERYSLTDQIRRSSRSIAANLAEGSKPEINSGVFTEDEPHPSGGSRMSRHDTYNKALSLAGLIISGILLGYYWQKLGDSGQIHIPKIVLTCTISAGSYLIAFSVIELLGKTRHSSHWLVYAFAGSALSAFNIKVVKYMIENMHDRYSPPLYQELFEIAPGFLATAVIYLIVTIIIMATIHFLGRQLERMFAS